MFASLNTPEDFLRVIRNHRWLIIWPIVICVGLAWGVYQWLPKSYRASALLNFELQKVQYVKGVEETGGGEVSDRGGLMSVRINLMKEFLYKQEILTQVAQEFHLYGYEKENSTEAQDDVVAARMRSLAEFDAKDAPFVRVSFADAEPEIARDVTMRLAQLFIQEFTQKRENITEASSQFLQKELDALKANLEVKERKLAQFKQSHLGQLPEQMEANLRAIDRLENEVTAQQETEKILRLRLESVENAIREHEDPTNKEGSLRRIEKDPRLKRIRELERKLAGFRSMYKETYPDVLGVKNELDQLKAMTTEEYIAIYVEQEPAEAEAGAAEKPKAIDPYMAGLLKQRRELVQELDLTRLRQNRIAENMRKYESRIEGTTLHQQELMVIQRDYENLQKSYQALLDKKLTVGMAGNLDKMRQGTQLRIIDPARVPTWPEKPKVLLIMLGGLAIGCVLGFGSALGIEAMRQGYTSAEEIEIALGVSVLATISHYDSVLLGPTKTSAWKPRRGEPLRALPQGRRMLEGTAALRAPELVIGQQLVAMWYPRSPVAEQYRIAATRMGLIAGKQKSTIVCITSSLMGEGKSSTALNMAYVLSRDLHRKTIIIDCDLKRPMVHSYLGMESTAGLAEVLLGTMTPDECIKYHEQLGLWVLTAGIEASGTAALSHVDRLSELLQGLRDRFEYIVIDTPPVLEVAEPALIVRMADVIAHVVRARSTPRDAVASALKTFEQDSVVTVILNGVEMQDARSSYYAYGNRAYEPHRKQLS